MSSLLTRHRKAAAPGGVREMPPLKDTVQLVHQLLEQLQIGVRPTKTLIS